MVKIQFLVDEFEIDLEGIEILETVKRKLKIPYSCISRVDDTAGDVYGGFKLLKRIPHLISENCNIC